MRFTCLNKPAPLLSQVSLIRVFLHLLFELLVIKITKLLEVSFCFPVRVGALCLNMGAPQGYSCLGWGFLVRAETPLTTDRNFHQYYCLNF